MSNDPICLQLREILATHGKAICHDPEQLRALLVAECGEVEQVRLLMDALEAKAVKRLLATPQGMLWEPISTPMVHHLTNELGHTEEQARWAIDTWGHVLGLINARSKGEQPPGFDDAPVLAGAGRKSWWKWW